MILRVAFILFLMQLIFSVSDGYGQAFDFTLDFESGNLRGWFQTGTAFQNQPTLGDNPTARERGQPSHHQGRYWIGTYEDYQGKPKQRPGQTQGDRPQGALTSQHFLIQKCTLSFLVSGGADFKTRVEFFIMDQIEGAVRVFYATGKNTETMERMVWDLTPHSGKTGMIRIVDESSEGWGHINVDDFRFEITLPPLQLSPPVARIDPSVQRVEAGQTAMFHSQSDAGSEATIKQIFWTGPENQTGSEPVITINTQGLPAGNYQISLMIRNSRGQTSRARARLEVVRPPALLIARIDPGQIRVKQGERVVFKNVSPVDPDTPLVRQEWQGPENRRSQGNSFDVFTGNLPPGQYTVTLSIEDRRGQRAFARANFEVVGYRPPVADIAPKNPTVIQSERLMFESISTPDPELTISGYFWRGPEGQTAQTPSFLLHTGNLKPTTYEVALTVVDSKGQRSGAARTNFRVLEPPPPPLAIIDPLYATVTKGARVEFHSLSKGDGKISERWQGPRGQGETGATFIIDTSDLEPATYTVTLEVKDHRQRTSQANADVVVFERPVPPPVSVVLYADPNPAEQGQVVRFSTAVSGAPGGGAEYLFRADETIIRDWAPEPRAEHAFPDEGIYTVMTFMRAGKNHYWESQPVTLTICPSQSPIIWRYLITGLLAAIVICVAARIYRSDVLFKQKKVNIQAVPYADLGTQVPDFAQSSDLYVEVHLRPIPDKGEQNIVTDALLVKDRRE